tara:strand:+ start:336 stop:575 length:240 start_codon:yes stop_codon:yes gene_type:complete
MTNPKKRKNNLILFFFLILFVIQFPLNINSIECKKYDIKCKSKKFIDDTIKFQKEGIKKGKTQVGQTKDKMMEKLPKKK